MKKIFSYKNFLNLIKESSNMIENIDEESKFGNNFWTYENDSEELSGYFDELDDDWAIQVESLERVFVHRKLNYNKEEIFDYTEILYKGEFAPGYEISFTAQTDHEDTYKKLIEDTEVNGGKKFLKVIREILNYLKFQNLDNAAADGDLLIDYRSLSFRVVLWETNDDGEPKFKSISDDDLLSYYKVEYDEEDKYCYYPWEKLIENTIGTSDSNSKRRGNTYGDYLVQGYIDTYLYYNDYTQPWSYLLRYHIESDLLNVIKDYLTKKYSLEELKDAVDSIDSEYIESLGETEFSIEEFKSFFTDNEEEMLKHFEDDDNIEEIRRVYDNMEEASRADQDYSDLEDQFIDKVKHNWEDYIDFIDFSVWKKSQKSRWVEDEKKYHYYEEDTRFVKIGYQAEMFKYFYDYKDTDYVERWVYDRKLSDIIEDFVNDNIERISFEPHIENYGDVDDKEFNEELIHHFNSVIERLTKTTTT